MKFHEILNKNNILNVYGFYAIQVKADLLRKELTLKFWQIASFGRISNGTPKHLMLLVFIPRLITIIWVWSSIVRNYIMWLGVFRMNSKRNSFVKICFDLWIENKIPKKMSVYKTRTQNFGKGQFSKSHGQKLHGQFPWNYSYNEIILSELFNRFKFSSTQNFWSS